METTTTAVILNIAYFFYVGSTWFRSLLPLRVVLTIGSVLFITWGVMVDNTSTIVWNSLFTVMNTAQIIRILRERNAFELSEEEEAIHRTILSAMDPLDFLYMWKKGLEHSIPPSSVLINMHESVDRLVLVLEGVAEVSRGGVVVGHATPMVFVGEMSLMSGDAATATVVASTDMRVRSWSHDELLALDRDRPEALAALWRALGQDITRKALG